MDEVITKPFKAREMETALELWCVSDGVGSV